MLRFITFILFLLTQNLSIGQSYKYHPFVFPNSQWNEISWEAPEPPSYCALSYKYSLFISKDTLINNQNYYKIYKSGRSYANCPYTAQPYENIYVGAIRQDSVHKKVSFVPYENSTDTLLYDFNLNIGDTLPQTYNNYKGHYYVLKTDSALVGKVYHKRFLLGLVGQAAKVDTNVSIIEGIGSTYGLFNLMMPPFESGTYLVCYSANNDNYPANSNCNKVLAITTTQKLTTSIYPNPTISKFTIETEKPLSNANLILTNNSGNIVLQLNHISGQRISIDRGNFTSGIYYLRLYDGSNEYSGKVIISDK